MRKMCLLVTSELYFHVMSLWLCLAVLYLHVKPAQLLSFLLSSFWCRQTHQSGTVSSNYHLLTALCQAGTCPFFCGWHWWLIQLVPFFFFCFSVSQAFIADDWQTIWGHPIWGNYSHCLRHGLTHEECTHLHYTDAHLTTTVRPTQGTCCNIYRSFSTYRYSCG